MAATDGTMLSGTVDSGATLMLFTIWEKTAMYVRSVWVVVGSPATTACMTKLPILFNSPPHPVGGPFVAETSIPQLPTPVWSEKNICGLTFFVHRLSQISTDYFNI